MPGNSRRGLVLRLAPGLAALATFLAFLPALRDGWTNWDDPANFLLNENYRGFGWERLKWMLTQFHMGHYHPLTWLTLALDYVLWGMEPFGYHLTNVLIHAANAGLVCLVCVELLKNYGNGDGHPNGTDLPLVGGGPTSAPSAPRGFYGNGWGLGWAALLGSIFWSLHPLRVEAVAWITERREVLGSFFYLLAVLAYLRWARGARLLWYRLTLAAFVCALLSKAMAVTLPLALLILDAYPLRRLSRTSIVEKAPLAALSAAFGLVACLAQQSAGAVSSLSSLGLPERIVRAGYAFCFYPAKTAVPTGLAPFYGIPWPFNVFAPVFAAAAAAAAVLIVLAWLGRVRFPWAASAFAFYAVSVAPVLGLFAVGNYLAADRYSYLPAMSLAPLAAAGLLAVPARRKAASWLAAGVIAAGLAVLSGRQCGFWRDGESVWARVLAVSPDSAMARQSLGLAASEAGNFDAATFHYRAARSLWPHSRRLRRFLAEAQYNQGNVLLREGRLAQAVLAYESALGQEPALAQARNNLGLALFRQGRFGAACGAYAAALKLQPGFAEAHYNLGNALARRDRLPEAERQYREALKSAPELLDARFNLGNTLARRGRFRDAAREYRAVMRGRPEFPGAAENLERTRRLGGF
ncbi:MAG: tetratricopeptide repeat protein [Elusimicrobia bacterium]|nr:tetratricopeptide repeat protein [Elusimicrobiota bacterium]